MIFFYWYHLVKFVRKILGKIGGTPFANLSKQFSSSENELKGKPTRTLDDIPEPYTRV
jgi:hypothetical protein